jgi:Predicted metal-binding, possibly nucleic acid-binding protein
MSRDLPFSEPLRMNQIGAGVTRRLEPDAEAARRIARSLDLQALEELTAEVSVTPSGEGWTLSGRITAHVVQTCGLTLEPLPADVDRRFSIALTESPTEQDEEIEVSLDDEDADLVEDGRIDLGQYVVEQLSLALDPFPRKPGAEFVQPQEPAEISPFAALKALKTNPKSGEG